MKKDRILFEAGPITDPRRTGVGHYTTQLVASLSEKYSGKTELCGYYFNFMNRGNSKPPQELKIAYYRITLIPGKILSFCRRLGFQPPLEIFVPRRADVVLFTNYVSLPSMQKHTTVLVVYDLSFLDYPEYLQDINLAYLRKFCPPSIRQADIIITISEFTKERSLHHFPDITANIVITPIPPIPITSREQLSTKLTGLGVQPKGYVLYLGTIEPRKNIQNLVKAYAALPVPLRDQYALVIAGGKGWKDGAIVSEINYQVSQGLRIIQTGYISDSDKNALYSNAACFVLPSHYEGFGMPILEAMLYGVPVAVSDIPVFHEVAENAALYFNKDSPEDIAQKISRVLTDKDLRTDLTKKGSARLETSSWSRNAELVYRAITNRIT